MAVFLLVDSFAFARKTNQSLYEDPFDVGSGGATLTWATQEGILLSNPALLPYGGKFMRWLGAKSTFMAGADSIQLGRDLISSSSGQSSGEDTENTEEEKDVNDQINTLFENPLHIGASQTLSLITANGGLVAFSSVEPDIRAYKKGDPVSGSGVPQVVVRNEAYAGAVASLASRSMWRWLSFGLSGKYLLINDPTVTIDFTDQESISNVTDQANTTQNVSELNSGVGFDGSMLVFFQGNNVDLKVASTVVDIGGTALTGGAEERVLPQMVHAGLGLTFHTSADALHLAVDYRDITDAYEEEMFKRVYAGAKLLLRTYLGIGAGVYHGTPSFAAEVDLILMRVALSFYTREYGPRPGVDPRPILMLSVSTGFDF